MSHSKIARAQTFGAVAFACAVALAACHSDGTNAPAAVASVGHSSSMALSADGKTLFVVNPDNDTVSVIDVASRALTHEILLAASAPTADGNGAYAPSVMPRAAIFSVDQKTVYVTGERASALFAIDVATATVKGNVHVGSEPMGLVISGDGASLYVACSQDDTIVKIDAASFKVTASVTVPNEPFSLAWGADGKLLTSHFMGPGITAIDPDTLQATTYTIPDMAPRGNRDLAHGQVRGLYDLSVRPGTTDVWVIHALLGTDTAQPTLDFQSTAFPAMSILHEDGAYVQTLTTDSSTVAGIDGSFGDVVSGPQALAFTHDGDYALMVDANSEDVLIVDAESRQESSIVRPLHDTTSTESGKIPSGIILAPDESFAYVEERVSGDVVFLKLDRASGVLKATVDGAPVSRWMSDPMPPTIRLGQHLFNSANSSDYPITTDHWIACATCHMEGRSDEVTWRFAQGPRDTPTNAGGVLGTGFLFRTADRNKVQDYWHTVNIEQGGHFDPIAQATLLDAITAYVNLGIPVPIPPTTDPALVAHGKDVFTSAGCDGCHVGPRFTDSGMGNPTLDLNGPILLHDIGTCVLSGPYNDVAHQDVVGVERGPCNFDTPSLTGLASTPPYLHDGSALTIHDAVLRMPSPPTDPYDLAALVEYLRSL